MILGLDHIAIAVPDLHAAIARFCEDLGMPLAGREDVPTQQTTTAFVPVGDTRIELIHPIDGQGPVQGFLDKRGGGLHHLCFRTDDIDADMQRLTDKGYRFLTAAPVPGAHGTRVVFIHPKSAGGVLIELAEHPADAGHA
ncbi:MAG: methylmalonyl-CoA epimerase [Alphaproteobacteria bacterium]|nr:methylmalonyl-CoA epimerase [Alphaproteobacteria bacterium]